MRIPGASRAPTRVPTPWCAALVALAAGCAPAGGAPDAATPVPAPAAPDAAAGAQERPFVQAATPVAAGEYLFVVGGCHDCHTPGWNETMGDVPPAGQLLGSPVGYRGPWGTTYAENLRLFASRISEDEWVEALRTALGGRGRPPMPWMNTARMHEQDLRAMYRYLQSLGAAGERMPRGLPSAEEPQTPYIWMVPQQPGAPAPQ